MSMAYSIFTVYTGNASGISSSVTRVSRSHSKSKIFPGFINQFGSRDCLMLRITSIVSRPSSVFKDSFFPRPIPCSPYCAGSVVFP